MHWDEIIWVVLSDILSDEISGTLVVLLAWCISQMYAPPGLPGHFNLWVFSLRIAFLACRLAWRTGAGRVTLKASGPS